MKIRNRTFLVIILFLLTSSMGVAQEVPSPPPPTPPPGLPIDTILPLVLALALIYGIKQVYKKQIQIK